MKKRYWVDIDGYDTEIYFSVIDDEEATDDQHIRLAQARKEALQYLNSMIEEFKEAKRRIKRLKISDVGQKEWS